MKAPLTGISVGHNMHIGAYMNQEYFCQSCGELFEAEVPPDAPSTLPECPSCGSREVGRQEPITNSPKLASRYDRGMCACEITALSRGQRGRS
jgi:putative FmdB family regulatory protein